MKMYWGNHLIAPKRCDSGSGYGIVCIFSGSNLILCAVNLSVGDKDGSNNSLDDCHSMEKFCRIL